MQLYCWPGELYFAMQHNQFAVAETFALNDLLMRFYEIRRVFCQVCDEKLNRKLVNLKVVVKQQFHRSV